MGKWQKKKTRLGLGAHLSVAGGVSRAMVAARELDLRSLQIFTKNANRWHQTAVPVEEAERFRDLKQAWGPYPVMSHNSYLINLASPDRALWNKSLTALIDELQRAELLGLDYLIMHPGAHVGSGVRAGLARIARGIRRVLDRFPDGSTRILLENTAGQGSTLGRTFEELADLLQEIDDPRRVGICLDTCHLFAAGYDLRTRRGYEKTLGELDSWLGAEHVHALHLNDSRGELGSHLDRHEHIGQGRIGRSGFRWLLQDQRFFGKPKVLETPKEGNMDPVNLEVLYSLG